MILITATCSNAKAQKPLTPGGKPIVKPVFRAPLPTSDSVEEKLVALALKGPAMRGAESQNKINQYQLLAAKNTWANLLTVSLNYNDQSFTKPVPGGYVYPKYFFGLNIPLGTVFSRTGVKAAREEVEIGKTTEEQLTRTIRADVLSKYKQYKTYAELIKLQNDVVVSEQTVLTKIEARANDLSFSIEAYNLALKTLNTEKASILNLQLQRDLVKLELEKMIGTKLESVINY